MRPWNYVSLQILFPAMERPSFAYTLPASTMSMSTIAKENTRLEGAGHVEALGEGVSDVSIGDAVVWVGPLGGYAEKAVVRSIFLRP
jgi:hypothetical protein